MFKEGLHTQGGGFLIMQNVPLPASSSVADLTPAMSSKGASGDGTFMLSAAPCEHYDVGDDSICVAADVTDPIHFYNYHIVYLPSYSVPTLLFTGQHEGRIGRRYTQLCVRTYIRTDYVIGH